MFLPHNYGWNNKFHLYQVLQSYICDRTLKTLRGNWPVIKGLYSSYIRRNMRGCAAPRGTFAGSLWLLHKLLLNYYHAHFSPIRWAWWTGGFQLKTKTQNTGGTSQKGAPPFVFSSVYLRLTVVYLRWLVFNLLTLNTFFEYSNHLSDEVIEENFSKHITTNRFFFTLDKQ